MAGLKLLYVQIHPLRFFSYKIFVYCFFEDLFLKQLVTLLGQYFDLSFNFAALPCPFRLQTFVLFFFGPNHSRTSINGRRFLACRLP
nr:MAG TPA: hypothetical protein [Caudoviricetes sp.]